MTRTRQKDDNAHALMNAEARTTDVGREHPLRRTLYYPAEVQTFHPPPEPAETGSFPVGSLVPPRSIKSRNVFTALRSTSDCSAYLILSGRGELLPFHLRVAPNARSPAAFQYSRPCFFFRGDPFSLKRARVERAPPVMCKYDCSRVPRSASTRGKRVALSLSYTGRGCEDEWASATGPNLACSCR